MKQFLHKKIPAALMALCLLLALCCQTLAAGRTLVPGGYTVGIKLYAEGLMVTEVEPDAPAQRAGLRRGDVILTAGGKKTASAQALLDSIQSAEPIVVRVERGGHEAEFLVTPEKTASGYRLGILVRDHIAGIGTVTYYEPLSLQYGALGHGVSNTKGNLLHMKSGDAYDAAVLTVKKGKCGEPGQLKGTANTDTVIGELLRNTPQGVFGVTKRGWKGEPLPTASEEDIHTGKAAILSTVSGDTPREYSVEILKIYPKDRTDGRNLLLKVTDETLLEATGGIVQGMSGSPIIQDGKLVGAVTHVLVNDPTTGYGIFIENMLDAAG